MGVVAACAAGLATIAVPAPVGAAAPVLTLSANTVGRGGTITVSPTGCVSPPPDPNSDVYIYRFPQVSLISQTPDGEVQAALGAAQGDGPSSKITAPGWLDPADPAVVAGFCRQVTISPDKDVQSQYFVYPDVAVDITAGSATAVSPVFTLDRTTAAGGQVLTGTGTGCRPAPPSSEGNIGFGFVTLTPGSDLSGRTSVAGAASASTDFTGSSFTVEIALNTFPQFNEKLVKQLAGAALPEGPYTVVAGCVSESRFSVGIDLARPQVIQIVGTNPSEQISLNQATDDSLILAGTGCDGGRTVSATFQGYAGGQFENFAATTQRDRRSGALPAAPLPDSDGQFSEVIEATPDGAGAWSLSWTPPSTSYDVQVTTDCGDPHTAGFRYVDQQWFESNWADLYLERISPSTSPAGQPVSVHARGECDSGAGLAVVDQQKGLLAVAPLNGPNDYGMFSGTVSAPATAGSYFLEATCDGKSGGLQPFDVFAADPVARTAPLPAEPKTGWPSEGGRDTYHGRIGPISLPVEDMGMGNAVTKDLGSSGFFIAIPRPAGDFAITKMSFDLVDPEGMPVSKEDVHLHHFVIANKSSKNPACPQSTFGLPGEIVGAAGAERTVLDFGAGPYGVMVKGTDLWTGVYDLMNMSTAKRSVFLTYDIEYRRDVANVRPVKRYFGSATGCRSFTWTIDGSGTPDVQSGYVEITEPGRLIGAGGHVHNGGLYSSLTDDRGREICRSTISFGAGSMGSMGSAAPVSPATTSVTVPPMNGSPPEFYDDDPPIAGISSCALAEEVKAGQRFRFDAVYDNKKARSGVMGIFTMYVWEGGGPATPEVAPVDAVAPPATAVMGDPHYAG